jgi:hypothetical protein
MNTQSRIVTTIGRGSCLVWFSEEKKIPEFGSVNLDPTGSDITLPLVAALTSSSESADRGRSIIQVTLLSTSCGISSLYYTFFSLIKWHLKVTGKWPFLMFMGSLWNYTQSRIVTTIGRGSCLVWFSEEKKIPEFGFVNLDFAGSVLVFSSLQGLILVGL